MRRKISLYVAGQLVDLADQFFILFNYTMEDLSNPTIVKNSFSQSITLKGTPNNNKIFGDVFRLDRVTQYGDTASGVNFSAIRKTPFAIYNELNEIIESGYLKLDDVTKSRGMVEYKVTLFGGLGSFFYVLMYNEDGSKKTLVDMRYRLLDGGYSKIPGYLSVGGYDMLKDAWAYIADPLNYDVNAYDNWWPDIINFAPAYNGLPDGFSADKAVVDNKSFANVPYAQVIDGAAYTFKTGTSSNLMLFSNPHTEWEIKDLRWYLQRPVISMRAIFDAICDSENNGGWNVTINQLVKNTIIKDSWMTLPLIPKDDRANPDAIVKLLRGMKSPAEYMISFAKILGLVFLCDSASKTIVIMPRAEFYESYETIDLTERVDVRSIKITPVLSQSRIYQFGSSAIGEWAKRYKEDYGIDYAVQRVNTGNEFNNDTTIVTDGIVYKDAVEVQERSLLFTSNSLVAMQSVLEQEDFILPLYEGVKVQLWGTKSGDSEQSREEVDVLLKYENKRFFNNPQYPLSDWLPKAQFHEANKPVDGSEVLLLFNGVKETPQWASWVKMQYRLTDDTPDMAELNEGVPCWNFTQENSRMVSSLPSFRRCQTYDVDGDEVISMTYEWGEPLARGVNGVFQDSTAPVTIYNQWWRSYQQDRYDDDTFKMTCKVNLRGLRVGQDLMRKFLYFQNAVFVLNAIKNHSLTTWDDTECEFVKVQEKSNYQK